jgi:hypothetical protein
MRITRPTDPRAPPETTMLAYTFWHCPRPEIDAAGYEADLRAFHERLSAAPIPGFVDSWSLPVLDLPWLAGAGYEDWYLIDDFAALGTLNEHAIDAARVQTHDAMARAVEKGAGGVYGLTEGDPLARSGWCGWFTKQAGVRYPQLHAELTQRLNDGTIDAVWQRQLVLGPATEFRILASDPVTVPGADLTIGMPLNVV